MSDIADVISRMIEKKLASVHCSMICKIIEFDGETMRADVQPQIQHVNDDGTQTDFPIIPGVPVEFLVSGDYYIRPEYEKDDLVSVSFYKYDIDSILAGGKSADNSMEYSIESARVTGGIAKDGWTAPDEFTESGLLIGSKNGEISILIQAETGVTINTSEKVILEATGGVEITGAVNINSGNLEVFE